MGVGLCGAQSIAIAEFQVVRPIFVVAPNLIGADKTSRKWAESAVRSVLRCHKLCENRPRRRVFRSSLAELQMEKDSMAERGEFELPVPISEQPDDDVMSGSGAQTKRRDRLEAQTQGRLMPRQDSKQTFPSCAMNEIAH